MSFLCAYWKNPIKKVYICMKEYGQKAMQKNKIGQMSIFLIIIVLLLTMVGTYLLLKSDARGAAQEKSDSSALQSSEKAAPISLFVEQCLRSTVKKSIAEVAIRGGEYPSGENTLEYYSIGLPYVWEGNGSNLATKESMEIAISSYVEDHLDECIGGFIPFRKRGMDIKGKMERVSSLLTTDALTVSLHYPITFSYEGEEIKMSNFIIEQKTVLEKVRLALSGFMVEQEEFPDGIPLSSLARMAKEGNFSFEQQSFGGGKFAFGIIFNDSDKQTKVFGFAERFDWNSSTPQKRRIAVESHPPVLLTSNDAYLSRIIAKGSDLHFVSHSEIVDINPNTGEFAINPANLEDREDFVLIEVQDGQGNMGDTLLELTINKGENPPLLREMANYSGSVGELVEYEAGLLNGSAGKVVFLDDSPFFDIHPLSGKINFTPTQKGSYYVKITAINPYGEDVLWWKVDIQ